jgi:hypothetical protein
LGIFLLYDKTHFFQSSGDFFPSFEGVGFIPKFSICVSFGKQGVHESIFSRGVAALLV